MRNAQLLSSLSLSLRSIVASAGRQLIFLTLPHPICLRFLPRHCLLFCRSGPSCPAGCCIASLHAAASPASASCCAITSRSSALAPLVWLVVASILLTPSCPICRLHCLEGWDWAADHLGLPPSPLAASLPLVLLLLRLLSGWLLCHLSSCRRIPCQRLCLSSRRRLSFLCSCDSCPAGCCVAVHPVRQPQLHRHPTSKVQLELVQHRLQVADHRQQHYVPPHPAPALVPPGNGVSKLPLCGQDTGLERRERHCCRRTTRRGTVGDVIVVDCAIKHPPRPSACMHIVSGRGCKSPGSHGEYNPTLDKKGCVIWG
jgi:hypothetical protein